MPPLPGNLLARAAQAGRQIVTVGKIGDIFAHRDTGLELKGKSNDEHVDLTLHALRETGDGGSDLRQSRRFRHRVRPSPRRRRLCGLSGGVRRRPAGDPSGAAPERLLRHHRRSRQRSDLARLRSHPRACADHRLRRRRRRGRSASARPSPTLPRRWPSSSGCRRGRGARAGCELRARPAASRGHAADRRLAAVACVVDERRSLSLGDPGSEQTRPRRNH